MCCNLTFSCFYLLFYYYFPLHGIYLKGFSPQLNENFCQAAPLNSTFVCLSPPTSLSHSPADISSYGYGQCQFSGAAGLNASHQSGHSCAEACGGAASPVGDPARLLLGPSGECVYQCEAKARRRSHGEKMNVQYIVQSIVLLGGLNSSEYLGQC